MEIKNKSLHRKQPVGKEFLIQSLCHKLFMTRSEAKQAIASIFGTISVELKNGNKISLPNFGKFETRELKRREGTNPRTGKKLVMEARKKPVFKFSENIYEKVNGVKHEK